MAPKRNLKMHIGKNIISPKAWVVLGPLVFCGLLSNSAALFGSASAFAQSEVIDARELNALPEEKSPALDSDGDRKVELPGGPPAIHPETFRMIETIERKNRELKRKEDLLRLKEQQLQVLEQKIQEDLRKIDAALAESQRQIGIQKDLIQENVASLVKAYSSMKPEAAAKLLEALDEDLALQIVSGMKSKVAGKVLSLLNVEVAKNISEKLAGKRIKRGNTP